MAAEWSRNMVFVFVNIVADLMVYGNDVAEHEY
jgi:hypothetical protein